MHSIDSHDHDPWDGCPFFLRREAFMSTFRSRGSLDIPLQALLTVVSASVSDCGSWAQVSLCAWHSACPAILRTSRLISRDSGSHHAIAIHDMNMWCEKPEWKDTHVHTCSFYKILSDTIMFSPCFSMVYYTGTSFSSVNTSVSMSLFEYYGLYIMCIHVL